MDTGSGDRVSSAIAWFVSLDLDGGAKEALDFVDMRAAQVVLQEYVMCPYYIPTAKGVLSTIRLEALLHQVLPEAECISSTPGGKATIAPSPLNALASPGILPIDWRKDEGRSGRLQRGR